MDVKPLECKLIDVPKTSNELRTFSKEFAIKLADSIRAESMYNAIVVRPNAAAPGRYLLVQGRHRFYAVRTVLKEQMIDCNIIADMDDWEAEMALIAENLWRNPLTRAQNIICVKKWFEHFLARHPEKVGRGKAGLAAAAKSRDTKKSASEADSSVDAAKDAEASESDAAEKVASFAATMAAATGQSERSARRTQKIAVAFSEDQLEVFSQMSVSRDDMLTISKIKDEAKRGEVVNLIASGMEPEDAIKEVMKGEAPARNNGSSRDANTAKAAAKEEKRPELSDDEWYETYCAEKGAMLGDPARFKADCLLYRAVTDARHAFRVKVKGHVKATAEKGVKGLFWFAMNRVISYSHPRDWTLCPDCKGAGKVNTTAGEATNCKKCGGGGYQMKQEEYL